MWFHRESSLSFTRNLIPRCFILFYELNTSNRQVQHPLMVFQAKEKKRPFQNSYYITCLGKQMRGREKGTIISKKDWGERSINT